MSDLASSRPSPDEPSDRALDSGVGGGHAPWTAEPRSAEPWRPEPWSAEPWTTDPWQIGTGKRSRPGSTGPGRTGTPTGRTRSPTSSRTWPTSPTRRRHAAPPRRRPRPVRRRSTTWSRPRGRSRRCWPTRRRHPGGRAGRRGRLVLRRGGAAAAAAADPTTTTRGSGGRWRRRCRACWARPRRTTTVRALLVLSNDPDDDVRDWACFALGTQLSEVDDAGAARRAGRAARRPARRHPVRGAARAGPAARRADPAGACRSGWPATTCSRWRSTRPARSGTRRCTRWCAAHLSGWDDDVVARVCAALRLTDPDGVGDDLLDGLAEWFAGGAPHASDDDRYWWSVTLQVLEHAEYRAPEIAEQVHARLAGEARATSLMLGSRLAQLAGDHGWWRWSPTYCGPGCRRVHERRRRGQHVRVGLGHDAVTEVEDVPGRLARPRRSPAAPPSRRPPTARTARTGRGCPAGPCRGPAPAATSSGVRQSTPTTSAPASAMAGRSSPVPTPKWILG